MKRFYKTPEGFSDLWMSSDREGLTGLWFEGSRDGRKHPEDSDAGSAPVLEETARWLDLYFGGQRPDFLPKLSIQGLTPFRQEVMELMLQIPYGKTVTYGDLAARIAAAHGMKKMSAQAVGGAVGWNPVCILVPCHRVLGAGGALTGYGGGLSNKIALLRQEGILLPPQK